MSRHRRAAIDAVVGLAAILAAVHEWHPHLAAAVMFVAASGCFLYVAGRRWLAD